MPVVPQFHVNAWGIPFASTWFGSTQVMPGPRFTPERLAKLIESEKVTMTAGVPTIWLGLLRELDRKDYDTSSLRAVLAGGSASPKWLIDAFEMRHHSPYYHAYGATETTPLVRVSRLKRYQQSISDEERIEERMSQEFLVSGVTQTFSDGNVDRSCDGASVCEVLLCSARRDEA